MKKTKEEIQALKDNWVKDPCWDIEDTDGFEDHQDELLAFRKDMEHQWEQAYLAKQTLRGEKVGAWTGIYDIDLAQCLFTPDEIEHELKDLDSQVGDCGSANEYAQFVIAREQVRATLLLTAQIKRVGDILQDMSTRESGESNIDFMTRLYKVE